MLCSIILEISGMSGLLKRVPQVLFVLPSDLFEFTLQFTPAGKAARLRVGGHVGREGVNLLLL